MKTYQLIALSAVVALFSCTKGEMPSNEGETTENVVTASKKYVLSVTASGSKALELSGDGNTITPSWQVGEEVDVYATISSVETKVGVLTAQSSGPSTELQGTLDLVHEFDPAVDDELILWFKKGDSTTPYAGQDGTFATIASTFDRAKAVVAISDITGDVITVGSDADFQSQQSISKFTFNQPVKYAVIISGDASVKENIVELATEKVAGEYPTEIFVAIPKVGTGAQSYNIYVGNESGTYKAVKTANLQNGKYYSASVSVAAEDATLLSGMAFNVALKKTVNPSFSGNAWTSQSFSSVNKKINFVSEQRNHVEGTLVSTDGSVPVWAYVDPSEGMKIVTMAKTFKSGTSMQGMFAFISGTITELGGLDLLDTSAATDMSSMFQNFGNYSTTNTSYLVSSLDLSSFDTSNVTSMSGMFYRCGAYNINLTGFNTSKVLFMYEMFRGCMGLASITGLNSFNTEKVTNMRHMFAGLYSMTSLDLSSFNTAKVTDMSNMFGRGGEWNPGFTSLNLSSFSTPLVTTMESMFDSCTSLASITLGTGFTNQKVTNLTKMFYRCSALTSLSLTNFTAPVVTTTESMFEDCTNLTSLSLVNTWGTTSLTNISKMFKGCTGLTSLGINGLWLNNVTNMSETFQNCSSLTSFTFGTLSVFAVTNYAGAFSGCTKLETLNLGTMRVKSTASVNNVLNNVGKASSTGKCIVYYRDVDSGDYINPYEAFSADIYGTMTYIEWHKSV